MEAKEPVSMEIGGKLHTFEYGKVECHMYRLTVDQPYDHIQATVSQNGLDQQRIYIFDSPREWMFLCGQELPQHPYKKKEVEKLITAMENTVGWEADLIMKDEAPEEIKDRYIKIATVALRSENVFIPRSWSNNNPS